MKIGVPSLGPGRHVLRSSSAASDYEGLAERSGLEFRSAIEVEAAVNKMVDDIFVQAAVRATVRIECARCLAEFDRELRARFEALYVVDREAGLSPTPSRREEREGERVFYYEGGVADLGEQVTEALLMAVPMKPLCREDCKGLCPSCGSDLNKGRCGCVARGAGHTPFKGLLGGAGRREGS